MKKAQMTETIESFIKKVKDPRRKQGVRYPFNAILSMMLLSIACGHSGYRPMDRFMKANLDFFEKEFGLKYGTPTYTMLKGLIEGINKQEIVQLFNEWSAQTIKLKPDEWISGDGKLLISTITDAHNSKQDFVSMVSLYAQDLGLCLFIQDYQSKKKSEIHVLEAMLEHLKEKKVTITLDALHCQKKTIKSIIDRGFDYVVQLKGNQINLNKMIEDGLKSVDVLVLEENKEDAMLIEQATEELVVEPLDFFEESEKNHGRHSNWKVSVFDSRSIPDTKGVLSLWSELNTIICVQRTVVHTNSKNTKNDRCNKAYYISNRTDLTAKEFAKGIRKHWAIENGLHYEKDVVLKEDKNRIKNCNAAVVIAVFNTFAINFLRMIGFHGISDATIKFGFNFKKLLFNRRT